jgi:sterol desaturase/sphingolipid hydroxylase (fatty acid hydroxylase superfamily)
MKHEINLDDEPIRLFKSDFLEFFTHIHPAVIVVIWTPVVMWNLMQPSLDPSIALSAGSIMLAFLLGIVIWSFTEYTMHRFVFHFSPKNPGPRLERIIYLFHGIHHHQPQLKTRLVMPPMVSIPLALGFWYLFKLVFVTLLHATPWLHPTFAGFLMGYIGYDLIHYATHHLPMEWGPLKALKRYHMQHHFKTPDQRYGVSSPSWDVVFGTKPEQKNARKSSSEKAAV